MSTETSIKENEDNARFTVCLDESRNSFTNEVDSNPDLFLAASLQFLHRLLAERTLHYAKLDGKDISTSRPEVDDIQQGKNTARQLYFQQIDQIEGYKGQLRSMENLLSTIQFDPEKPMLSNTADCDEIVLNEINDFEGSGDLRNFKSTKLLNDSYDFISRTPSPRASNHPYSFINYNDQFLSDIPEGAKIDTSEIDVPAAATLNVQKNVPDARSYFTGRLQARSVDPTWTSVKNNGVRSTASYADIVRNAVSGLARNCGKKHKSRRKKRGANSWLPEAGIMERPKEETRRRGYQSEVESDNGISSESHGRDGQGSDIPIEIPLRVQLAREPDASPRKPVTLLVRVPNTVFNLLNRKISNQDAKISSNDPLAETRSEPGKKKKKRITSVFRNLLKGRRTPSSTTVYSVKEKRPSSVTLALEKTVKNAGDQGCDTSRNTSIYTLQKSASYDSFERKSNAEIPCEVNSRSTLEPRDTERESLKCVFVPPTKSVNGYEKMSLNLSPRVISYKLKPWDENAAGNPRRTLAGDKALRTEVPSNKIEILKGLRSCRKEKIIPLRCSDGSPQLGNKPGAISQRDVDMFLNLATEMRKTQVYRDANRKHVEIPVEIKTTETPLHLHKTQKVSAEFLDHRVFRRETKSSQATPKTIEDQQFLEMLVGTLPGGAYLPEVKYSKSQELPSSVDSVKSGPQDNFRLLRKNADSALEVLLRHIATGTSMTPGTRSYAAEKDTTVQTAPKRQLSKISVCYSSESLSGSDPEVGMKDSTINQNEYGVRDRVQGNEYKKPGIQQYFHHCEGPEQDYTCRCANDKVVIFDKSEGRYGSVKILSSMGSTVTKNGNSNLNLSPFSLEDGRKLLPCSRTEVIIEEQNCSTIEAKVKTQVVMGSERTCLSIRETKNTVFCHPVLSKQIFGDRKEVADAMIRWWGPRINYSTTPSSQTQLTAYSVSINNLR